MLWFSTTRTALLKRVWAGEGKVGGWVVDLVNRQACMYEKKTSKYIIPGENDSGRVVLWDVHWVGSGRVSSGRFFAELFSMWG